MSLFCFVFARPANLSGQVKPPVNVLSWFKVWSSERPRMKFTVALPQNPMMIMMMVTLGIVVFMPKMMNNMGQLLARSDVCSYVRSLLLDPEELAEMKKMQSNMSLKKMLAPEGGQKK